MLAFFPCPVKDEDGEGQIGPAASQSFILWDGRGRQAK